MGRRSPVRAGRERGLALGIPALLALAACGPRGFAPLPIPPDPEVHGIYLVALGPTSAEYLVLERRSGAPPRLYAQYQDRRPHRSLLGAPETAQLAEMTTPWPDRETLARRLRDSDIGRTIEQVGYRWPELVPSDQIEVAGYPIAVTETGAVRMSLGDTSVVLFATPPDHAPEAHAWLLSADREILGVELVYPGMPQTQSLFVVQLDAARARLLSTAAYDAHQQGDYARAIHFWQDALRGAPDDLPPDDRIYSDAIYNLACAYALYGEPALAMQSLTEAVRRSPERYRSLARRDSDLSALRTRADFQELVFPR